MLKTLAKAWDASTDWGANVGQPRVVKTTGWMPSHLCAVCGKKATRRTDGVSHCTRTACLRDLGDLI